MLYVIPFVVLLLVLIVLKKRESANKEQAEKSNKANSRKSTKKNTTRSSQARQPQSKIVEDDVVIQKQTTPLKADFKKNIERLIQEKNYFSAEAKINQALNQDNSQHELYLYLLDVHQAHKDDLAIDQLLNHIRSLGLDDISAQADTKQKAYEEQVKESSADGIDFTLPTANQPQTPSLQKQSTAAFDALVSPNTTTASPNNSFDLLQSELSTEKSAPVEQTSIPTLDFSQELKEPQVQETQTEIKPLDFNFSLNSDTPSVTETPAEPVVKATTSDIQPLEFSFDLAPTSKETPLTEKAKTVIDPTDSSPEFQLDLPEPITHDVTEVALQDNLSPQIENKFDFNLDIAKEAPQEVPTALPNLDFNFESSVTQPVKTETVESTTITAPLLDTSFDAPKVELTSESTSTTQTSNDPLVQAFPELLSIDETQLNLDLAEKYIELGVYDSARQLLNGTQDYTTVQREQSENLLRRIAS